MIAHGNYIGDFSSFDKGSHVQMIIDCMANRLDNEHYYRPDVERTDGRFNDVFLPGVLREGLCRVNSEFLVKAIDETVVKQGRWKKVHWHSSMSLYTLLIAPTLSATGSMLCSPTSP